MLEKSNILQYHIFKHVLTDPEMQPIFENFGPNQSSTEESVPGSLAKLDEAFNKLFSQTKKLEMYQLIGGIYALSKVEFQNNNSNDGCVITSTHALEVAARLLSLDQNELSAALTSRIIQPTDNNGEIISYVDFE